MSFQEIKIVFYCDGQKHNSGTKNNVGGITFKEKTGREINLIVGQSSLCNKRAKMIVSDNTIEAGGLGDYFKLLGKSSVKLGKNVAKNTLKNPGRAVDITANVVTAVASRNPKSALSTLHEVINFIMQEKSCISEKLLDFTPNKSNKNQKDYTHQHHQKKMI